MHVLLVVSILLVMVHGACLFLQCVLDITNIVYEWNLYDLERPSTVLQVEYNNRNNSSYTTSSSNNRCY